MYSFKKILKRIPGFRSGNKIKALIALIFYFFLFLLILPFIIPFAPTLALDKIPPNLKKLRARGILLPPFKVWENNHPSQKPSYIWIPCSDIWGTRVGGVIIIINGELNTLSFPIAQISSSFSEKKALILAHSRTSSIKIHWITSRVGIYDVHSLPQR